MEQEKKVSKKLSYWLRHNPDDIGIKLDKQGWTDLQILMDKSNFDLDTILYVVEFNNKKRFEISEDQTKIRASQGHSVDVSLDLEEVKTPLDKLYHGTQMEFLRSIQKEGLQKMNRHHVHLSPDLETATNVGSRRGKAGLIILVIDANQMQLDNYKFYKSANCVYLIDEVPVKYIKVIP